MIDILFLFLDLACRLIPSLMINTGEIILAWLSLGYYCPRQLESEENDSLITIERPSFWVGILFWVCIGIYLYFNLSGN